MSEEERIKRVLQFLDPRDAEIVADNLKNMTPEERVELIS